MYYWEFARGKKHKRNKREYANLKKIMSEIKVC
jgi:hypothetical protein